MKQQESIVNPDEILVPSPCVSNKIGIIYRMITGAYNRAMKPYGITTVQRSILMFTKNFEPVNQQVISKVLSLEKSTCSRDIQGLVKKNYLQLVAGNDARNTLVSITEEGKKLLEITQPVWQNIHQKSEALLGKTSIDELDRIIVALKKNKNIYQ